MVLNLKLLLISPCLVWIPHLIFETPDVSELTLKTNRIVVLYGFGICWCFFTFTYPCAAVRSCFSAHLLTTKNDKREIQVIRIKKKTAFLAAQEDLLVDLTLHRVPASLIAEFGEKIVRPYYSGNLNAAIQDLIIKALSEQEFVHSHITHIKNQ